MESVKKILKQTELGFRTERDFICAVQVARRKIERSQLDEDILRAFVDDYDNTVRRIAKKKAYNDEGNKKAIAQHIWTQIIEQIDKWEYRGYKFTTWLYGVGMHAAADWWRKEGIIRLPHSLQRDIRTYTQTQEFLQKQLGRNPTQQELADKLKWNIAKLRKIALDKKDFDLIWLGQTTFTNEDGVKKMYVDRIPDPSQKDESMDETMIIIMECIEQLGEKYRIPFHLCHIEDCERAEVASMLGLNPKTLDTHIRRARKKIIQCLEKKGIIGV